MTPDEQIKTIVDRMNVGIRSYENDTGTDFDQIRYSLAGWGEYWATLMFDTTVASLDPQLAALLERIKEQGGKLVGDDAFQLAGYGIAALDLRAPEDL